LKRLYDWMMELAGHRHALWWLAIVSFIESSVFPIPPDVMLIPMVLAARHKAWRYAMVATLASVVGGWLGYAIGYSLFETLGRPVIAFYHLEAGFASFQAKFNEWGAWIVLLKGMTPIPYKLVTIASGVVHLDPVVFTLASIGSRAIRFFLVAGLLYAYGEPIRRFIEERLSLVTSAFVVLLVGGFLIIKFV
jgi:membrane protein YqaA with SNARE-associated domain